MHFKTVFDRSPIYITTFLHQKYHNNLKVIETDKQYLSAHIHKYFLAHASLMTTLF